MLGKRQFYDNEQNGSEGSEADYESYRYRKKLKKKKKKGYDQAYIDHPSKQQTSFESKNLIQKIAVNTTKFK